MNIAVIDSGIEKDYFLDSNFVDSIIGYKKVGTDIVATQEDQYVYDYNGHGTMSIDYIHRLQPNARIVSVRVLDEQGLSTSKVLEKALCDLIDSDIDIINISLSVLDNQIGDLDSICSKLQSQGKILVASVANGLELSYPASFYSVIGVSGISCRFPNEFWIDADNDIEFYFDKSPVIVKDSRYHLNLYLGNSKATCLATAMISDCLVKHSGISNKTELVKWFNRHKTIDSKIDMYCISQPKEKEFIRQKHKDIYNLEEALTQCLQCSIDELYEKRMFDFSLITPDVIIYLMEYWYCGEIPEDLVVIYREFEWFYSFLVEKERNEF